MMFVGDLPGITIRGWRSGDVLPDFQPLPLLVLVALIMKCKSW